MNKSPNIKPVCQNTQLRFRVYFLLHKSSEKKLYTQTYMTTQACVYIAFVYIMCNDIKLVLSSLAII